MYRRLLSGAALHPVGLAGGAAGAQRRGYGGGDRYDRRDSDRHDGYRSRDRSGRYGRGDSEVPLYLLEEAALLEDARRALWRAAAAYRIDLVGRGR
jgi:hypothetical protein